GAGEMELVKVPLDRTHRIRLGLDEHHGPRSPRQRLEAHRARPCIEIEDARRLDPGRDEVEDVLAHAVGGRACTEALRRVNRVTLALARDDAHQGRSSWRTSR